MDTIISEVDLQKAIQKNEKLLVVFTAFWNKPSQMLIKKLEECNLPVVSLDVDNAMDIALKYKISSVPTTLLFHNGEVVNVIEGNFDIEKDLII